MVRRRRVLGESLPAEAIHPRCHDRGHCTLDTAAHTGYHDNRIHLNLQTDLLQQGL